MGKGSRPVLSRELLVSLLDYDPVTGALLWKRRKGGRGFNKRYAGKPAGTKGVGRKDGSNKYLMVSITTDRERQYPAHRLIWTIMTGDPPPAMIDHLDGDEFNQRWKNLRPATNAQNLHNSKLRRDNKSGVKGVSWDGSRKKWMAVISVDRQHVRLGRFATVAEAARAVNDVRVRLHGEFARFS